MVRCATGASLLLAVVAVGCGGAKPAPVAPARPASGTVQIAAPLPELTAVGPSPELFAVARVRGPSKVADTAIAWSGLPVNWRALLAKEAPGVDTAVTLEAPIDFAATLDPGSSEEPHVLWAVSYGAPSVDAAATFLRKQGGTVEPEAGGGYLAHLDARVVCVVGRALGSSPARVVCSDEAANAVALAPYMTRGLATESLGAAEIHAHVTVEPFRRRYGSQLALVRTVGVPFALRELEVDHPKFDRALRDVLYGLADELIALSYDLERLDVDLALEPGNDSVALGTSLALSGKRSWWGQMTAAAAEHPGVAPDVFWKLPMDASGGSFNVYSDPGHLRGLAAALRQLLDGWLDYQGLADARRTAVADAFEQFLTVGAKSAYVSLPVAPSPAPATDPALRARESLRLALGAHLLVLDQGGDKLTRLASELVKALGDRSFRERLSKSKLLAGLELPALRERAPSPSRGGAVKGLPVGTKVFEIQIPASDFSGAGLSDMAGEPAPAPKTKGAKERKKVGEPLTAFLVAMPDGASTWFGFGTDEKALEARLVTARAGTGDTLARRDGLGALRTEPVLSAGFTSLGALLSSLGASPQREVKSLGHPASLERLPHRGETPMLWRMTADANGPKMTAVVHVPKTVVEDIVALAASHAPLRP